MATEQLIDMLGLLPAVRRAPSQSLWISYDEEGDVLYVTFRRPPGVTDSELTDDDVIIRYSGDEIVGYTILHASKRANADAA